jgi:hypothetical protein
MKTSPFKFVAPILLLGFAWSAMPSPAHAASDGLKLLATISHNQAEAANERALESESRLQDNRRNKEALRAIQNQFHLSAPASEADAPPVSPANLVVEGVAAVVEFESKASSDGLDDAELKSLAELVAAAQQRADSATADASTNIANAKKLLKETKTAGDKEHLKVYLKSLRATAKAHKQTAAALRTLAKKLAKTAH